MILVTGSTGNVGSAAVRELTDRNTPVRAFARNVSEARRRLPSAAQIVPGDFDDPGSLDRAFDAVTAVLVSSADGPDKVRHEQNIIDAAVRAGVTRIVKCSTLHAEIGSPLPPFHWHGLIEQHLQKTNVPFVIVRSAFYMTNILASLPTIRAQSAIVAPAGDAKIAMIDPRDTGAVVAAALTSPAMDGHVVEITGPEAVTYHDVAAALTSALGRPISYVDVPDAAATESLVAAGMPDWLVTHLGHLFPLLRNGAMGQPTAGVHTATGRDPRTVAEFARDVAPVAAG